MLSHSDTAKLAALEHLKHHPTESVQETARLFGLHKATLSRFLSDYRLFRIHEGLESTDSRSASSIKRAQIHSDVLKGLSRTELCQKYGLSMARINRYLYHGHKPEQIKREALVEIIRLNRGCTIQELMRLTGRSKTWVSQTRRDIQNGTR